MFLSRLVVKDMTNKVILTAILDFVFLFKMPKGENSTPTWISLYTC